MLVSKSRQRSFFFFFFNREFVWKCDGRFVNFQHIVAKGSTDLPNSDKAYRRS